MKEKVSTLKMVEKIIVNGISCVTDLMDEVCAFLMDARDVRRVKIFGRYSMDSMKGQLRVTDMYGKSYLINVSEDGRKEQ